MEVIRQLREELKEAVSKRKALIKKLKNIDFSINVFRKEVSLREN